MENKWNPVEWLKKRHTIELLNMRNSCYRVSGYNRHSVLAEHVFYDPFDSRRFYVSLAQIKAELATRPHVPNKKEARAIRQQRAKECQ